MTKRPTFEAFKAEAMQDPEFREEYEALEDEFQLKRRMIALRKAAGLTQEQTAEKLGTKKSSISRLESIDAENSPPGHDRGLRARIGLCHQGGL